MPGVQSATQISQNLWNHQAKTRLVQDGACGPYLILSALKAPWSWLIFEPHFKSSSSLTAGGKCTKQGISLLQAFPMWLQTSPHWPFLPSSYHSRVAWRTTPFFSPTFVTCFTSAVLHFHVYVCLLRDSHTFPLPKERGLYREIYRTQRRSS